MSYSRKVIILCLLVFCLASLALAMSKAPAHNDEAINNNPADFTLPDLTGHQQTLSKHQGKIIFLNFWATWCPPCREEMPSMQKLYDTWDKKKYVMLAVNLGEDRDTVKAFADKNHYTFPILLDLDQNVARQYRIQGIPTTIIIDAKGKIVDRIVGAKEWSVKDFK